MIGWIIIVTVAVLLTIGSFLLASFVDENFVFLGGALAFITIVFACILIFSPFSVKQQVGKFESQKLYLESHVASGTYDDVAITQTKIDMNDWLFRAQQANKAYGNFSFYPDSVWDLEPIQ